MPAMLTARLSKSSWFNKSSKRKTPAASVRARGGTREPMGAHAEREISARTSMAFDTPAMLTAPLKVIVEEFEELCKVGADKLGSGACISMASRVEKALKKPGVAAGLPSLNGRRQEQLPWGALVRFQGMIMDMRDPEYYAGIYEEVQPDGSVRLRTGKFRDSFDVPEGCTVRPRNEFTWQRTPIICAPIPGQTAWAAEAISGPALPTLAVDVSTTASPGAPARCKRSAEADMAETAAAEEDMDDDMAVDEPPKRPRAPGGEPADPSVCAPCQGGETGEDDRQAAAAWARSSALGSALVKLYDCDVDGSAEPSDLRLNDLVEVYGVLDIGGETDVCDGPTDSISMMMEEEKALRPPPSAQPRLHCLYYRKLPMGRAHPLLPPPDTYEESLAFQVARHHVARTRAAVLGALSGALCGDSLSAELLLYSIISRVLARRGEVPIGKLSLNITGCPAAVTAGGPSPVWTSVGAVLKELLPSLHEMPLTIDKLNQSKLIPEKDYEANSLVYGGLQMPAGSTLLLDETTLTSGKLDEAGVRNLGALGELAARQKVGYDFKYFPVEFEADVSLISISSAKTVLSASSAFCHLPLHIQPSAAPLPAALADPSLLHAARGYLGLAARSVVLDMPEPVALALQNDFVNARKVSKEVSPDDFAHWLTCSRLHAASLLATQIDESHYAHVRQLEASRVARLRAAEVCV